MDPAASKGASVEDSVSNLESIPKVLQILGGELLELLISSEAKDIDDDSCKRQTVLCIENYIFLIYDIKLFKIKIYFITQVTESQLYVSIEIILAYSISEKLVSTI